MTYSARELGAMALAGRLLRPEAVELRRWRRERCLSQDEVGKLLGVGLREVGKFECGTMRPNKDGSARIPKGWPELLARLYATWTPADMSAAARMRLANKIKERGLADPRLLWIPNNETGERS